MLFLYAMSRFRHCSSFLTSFYNEVKYFDNYKSEYLAGAFENYKLSHKVDRKKIQTFISLPTQSPVL